MNKYLYGIIAAAFVALLGLYANERLRVEKLHRNLAQTQAKQLDLEQKARELDLSQKTIEELSQALNAAEKSKLAAKDTIAGSSPISIPLEKGQPAPFTGILAQKDWVAKALACLEYQEPKRIALAECMTRELKLEAQTERLRSSRNFWRLATGGAVLAAGVYIGLQK